MVATGNVMADRLARQTALFLKSTLTQPEPGNTW